MKKLCAAITAALMLLCSPVTVCADNSETGSVLEPAQARYAYFRSVESNLTDNRDLTVTLSSAASGGSDTTKIEATQYLEKRSGGGGTQLTTGAIPSMETIWK